MALASDATFIAQSFSGDPKHATAMYVEAVRHPGFAMVNDFSPCVTYNRFNTYDWFRTHVEHIAPDHDATSQDAAWELIRDFERRDKLPLGVIYRHPRAKPEARRLPMWPDELEQIDLEPMLVGFREAVQPRVGGGAVSMEAPMRVARMWVPGEGSRLVAVDVSEVAELISPAGMPIASLEAVVELTRETGSTLLEVAREMLGRGRTVSYSDVTAPWLSSARRPRNAGASRSCSRCTPWAR